MTTSLRAPAPTVTFYGVDPAPTLFLREALGQVARVEELFRTGRGKARAYTADILIRQGTYPCGCAPRKDQSQHWRVDPEKGIMWHLGCKNQEQPKVPLPMQAEEVLRLLTADKRRMPKQQKPKERIARPYAGREVRYMGD